MGNQTFIYAMTNVLSVVGSSSLPFSLRLVIIILLFLFSMRETALKHCWFVVCFLDVICWMPFWLLGIAGVTLSFGTKYQVVLAIVLKTLLSCYAVFLLFISS